MPVHVRPARARPITAALSSLVLLAACGSTTAVITLPPGAEVVVAGSEAEVQRIERAHDAGMALHAEYMDLAPPDAANAATAQAWYAQQSGLMEQMEGAFAPVLESAAHDRALSAQVRLGEGWEKLAAELKAMHAKGLDAHPEKAAIVAEFEQAVRNAVARFEQVASVYPAKHPAVAERNAEAVAGARARLTALEALRAR